MNEMASLAVFSALFGMATMLYWMWVAWRAMRAHERLADSAERAAAEMRRD